MSYLDDLRPVAEAHPDHDPEELREVLDEAVEGLDALALLTTGRHPPGLASMDVDLIVRERRQAMGMPVCGSPAAPTRPKAGGCCAASARSYSADPTLSSLAPTLPENRAPGATGVMGTPGTMSLLPESSDCDDSLGPDRAPDGTPLPPVLWNGCRRSPRGGLIPGQSWCPTPAQPHYTDEWTESL